MRVAYDMAPMGAVYQHPRTGIPRYLETLALHLMERCQLRFCASTTYQDLDGVRAYRRSQAAFARIGELSSTADRLLYRWLKPLTKQPNPLRRVRHYVETRLPCLDAAALNQVEVYHATFYPFPEHLRSYQQIGRVQTVFDLIPLRHPEFFEGMAYQEATIAMLAGICRKLGPEDVVVCISESTRQDVLAYSPGALPERIVVTPLAASETFYRASAEAIAAVRSRYRIPEAPYVLSLCTLEPRKNIEALIRAFARLVTSERINDLNLVLVGTKGWQYERIFAAIAECRGLEDRIFTPGYVSDGDIAAIYSGALVFAYPSLYEGFGLPPLEAMQCGVPVVTSNTSSLPEVVGDAGLMVSPRDGDALCQALLQIYRDAHLRETLAARSQARAREFSWQRCAEQTLAAYRLAAQS